MVFVLYTLIPGISVFLATRSILQGAQEAGLWHQLSAFQFLWPKLSKLVAHNDGTPMNVCSFTRFLDVCICLASAGAFLCSTRGLQFSPWLRVDSDLELPSTWKQAWQVWQMCLELTMCETINNVLWQLLHKCVCWQASGYLRWAGDLSDDAALDQQPIPRFAACWRLKTAAWFQHKGPQHRMPLPSTLYPFSSRSILRPKKSWCKRCNLGVRSRTGDPLAWVAVDWPPHRLCFRGLAFWCFLLFSYSHEQA